MYKQQIGPSQAGFLQRNPALSRSWGDARRADILKASGTGGISFIILACRKALLYQGVRMTNAEDTSDNVRET